MKMDCNRLTCSITIEPPYRKEWMLGYVKFKIPCYTGEFSYQIRVWEYRRLISTLQVLADSMGTEREEFIGNTEGNIFFKLKLKKTGKVFGHYELSEGHRLVDKNKPVFKGRFEADHLQIGSWLQQAKEDLKAVRPCPLLHLVQTAKSLPLITV